MPVFAFLSVALLVSTAFLLHKIGNAPKETLSVNSEAVNSEQESFENSNYMDSSTIIDSKAESTAKRIAEIHAELALIDKEEEISEATLNSVIAEYQPIVDYEKYRTFVRGSADRLKDAQGKIDDARLAYGERFDKILAKRKALNAELKSLTQNL